jgi:hypothetical protein
MKDFIPHFPGQSNPYAPETLWDWQYTLVDLEQKLIKYKNRQPNRSFDETERRIIEAKDNIRKLKLKELLK